MNEMEKETQAYVVLGQKYAYATASLVMGIISFMNVVGMEKAVVAIIFAWLALKTDPAPALKKRRTWAKVGLTLGVVVLIAIPTLLVIYIDGLREMIEALEKLSSGK